MDQLSVVMPVYNEYDYVLDSLRRVQSASLNGLAREIIVVDDGSTDGTQDRLRNLEETDGLNADSITVLFQDNNRGKGAALRRGFEEATGDVVVVQDADLEYDPGEYERLLEPILDDRADVVFGSRFRGGPQRVLYFWHYAGNRLLTLFSNMLTNLNLSDMETCYKMFRRDVLESIDLAENGFGFEPEVTARVARGGYRIYEVPISYFGRTYEEGKKIHWTDGLVTLWCILKYNVFVS